LHFIDTGSNVTKLRFTADNESILDQLKNRIASNQYPLFISGGSAQDKLKRIRSNPYFNDAYESLKACKKALFIFGHSLSSRDSHIITAIAESPMDPIYVSVLSSATESEKCKLEAQANLILEKRQPRSGKIFYYEAESAEVWPTNLGGWDAL